MLVVDDFEIGPESFERLHVEVWKADKTVWKDGPLPTSFSNYSRPSFSIFKSFKHAAAFTFCINFINAFLLSDRKIQEITIFMKIYSD